MINDPATNSALDYLAPPRKPRRWWLLAVFAVGAFVLEDFIFGHVTPPDLPSQTDEVLMLIIPLGAIVLSIATSIPHWIIGLYGIEAASAFLLGQLSDSNLQYQLSAPGGVREFVIEWGFFFFASWLIARCTVLLCRKTFHHGESV